MHVLQGGKGKYHKQYISEDNNIEIDIMIIIAESTTANDDNL